MGLEERKRYFKIEKIAEQTAEQGLTTCAGSIILAFTLNY